MTQLELPNRSAITGSWLAQVAAGALGAVASSYLSLSAIGQAGNPGSDLESRLPVPVPAAVDAPASTVVDEAGGGGGAADEAAGPTVTEAAQSTSAPAGASTTVDCPPVLSLSFELNGADVDAEMLDAAAPALIAWLQDHADVEMVIEGHADALGSEQDNLALSYRRAEVVVEALVDRGAPADQLTPRGLGEYQRLAGEPAESGANRRVTADVPGLAGCPASSEEER